MGLIFKRFELRIFCYLFEIYADENGQKTCEREKLKNKFIQKLYSNSINNEC